ncbi:hypothetical protein IAT40_000240 [Kwoniella sp. CBS 6097]
MEAWNNDVIRDMIFSYLPRRQLFALLTVSRRFWEILVPVLYRKVRLADYETVIGGCKSASRQKTYLEAVRTIDLFRAHTLEELVRWPNLFDLFPVVTTVESTCETLKRECYTGETTYKLEYRKHIKILRQNGQAEWIRHPPKPSSFADDMGCKDVSTDVTVRIINDTDNNGREPVGLWDEIAITLLREVEEANSGRMTFFVLGGVHDNGPFLKMFRTMDERHFLAIEQLHLRTFDVEAVQMINICASTVKRFQFHQNIGISFNDLMCNFDASIFPLMEVLGIGCYYDGSVTDVSLTGEKIPLFQPRPKLRYVHFTLDYRQDQALVPGVRRNDIEWVRRLARTLYSLFVDPQRAIVRLYFRGSADLHRQLYEALQQEAEKIKQGISHCLDR